MENEVPKKEEVPVVPVAEAKEVGAVMETKAETVVMIEEQEKKKPSLKEIADRVCGFVSKVDRTTKTFVVIFVVFALLFVGYTYFKGTFVAATVNGVEMSRLSVVRELEKQAGKNILDTMITKKLIETEMKKQKIVVAGSAVDAEVKKVEDQIATQGGTLEQALEGQGMTMTDLREQLLVNKQLEQLLADKIAVSDEEVNQYLSKAQFPVGEGVSSEDQMAQVREQLKQQKLNKEASSWVTDLRAKATIEYSPLYQ